jgi:hypothetical protein
MAGLFDFLKDPEARKQIIQGLTDSANRGMVAATLGAPVDAMGNVINLGIAGAGYLGHKAGLIDQPPPLIDMSQAVGSSEWIGQQMQNAGIVSENRNPIAEAGFSMLTPAAGRVPGAIAAGARKAAQNAAAPSDMIMQGQKGAVYIGKNKISNNAFHGTDRQFDRFSDEKIGSSNANLGDAFWLTDDYGHARGYAQQASGSKTGNIVKEANVFLKKPMIVDAMDSANKLADDIGRRPLIFLVTQIGFGS